MYLTLETATTKKQHTHAYTSLKSRTHEPEKQNIETKKKSIRAQDFLATTPPLNSSSGTTVHEKKKKHKSMPYNSTLLSKPVAEQWYGREAAS